MAPLLTKLLHLLPLLVAFAIAGAMPCEAQQKSIDKLKQQKTAATRQINEANKKLKANTRETARQLSRLEGLRADMQRQNQVIADARQKADSVSTAIVRLNDTIDRMSADLDNLRKAYGSALRRMQSMAHPANTLSYILAADNVEQGYRRLRYLRQFSKWRQRKSRQVTEARNQLAVRREELAAMSRDRADALQRLDVATRKLKSQQAETETLVASLKKEEVNLRALLRESELKKQKLDKEIDRLITAEQERQAKARREKAQREKERKAAERAKQNSGKPGSTTKPATPAPRPNPSTPEEREADADRALSGSFASNKGNLLFPVAGRYTIVKRFGRQPHPELRHVETDNSGIDIETGGAATVRAVYEGTVSAIFRQPGFNTIVMVRHGEYITIYAGLGSISVKNGQSLKAGQAIGTVAADPEQNNRYIFHFEIRKERTKLNPLDWVR
ncbi:MAG: peptidoglycan DD-metalloendopeptidase family protein [Bacteroides sp.]|nr:peptidoglycan DD-metalloendopeptidase family protein [Bacteroides sp.]